MSAHLGGFSVFIRPRDKGTFYYFIFFVAGNYLTNGDETYVTDKGTELENEDK